MSKLRLAGAAGVDAHILSLAVLSPSALPQRAMAAEVPEDAVRIFAACGTYGEIARQIEARLGGVADSIDLQFPRDK